MFYLPAIIFPLLLVPVFLGIVEQSVNVKRVIVAVGLVFFVLAEVYIVFFNTSNFPFYKPVTTGLNIEGSVIVKKESLPEGYFLVLDTIAEFNNTDLSNNYGLLKMGPPPRSYGVYKDGRRISSLIKEIPSDFSYLNGALDSYPYVIRSQAKVLLAGNQRRFPYF